jgi:phosphate transport system protein
MERHYFEDELQQLKNRLLNMGALVEQRVNRTVRGLVSRNQGMIMAVATGDKEINELQIEIDDRCLKLLALQNPMASDLRLITAAMKINSDLERIGDQAVNIAEYSLKIINLPLLKPLIDIPRMAEMAEGMVRDSLDAFVRKDSPLAREILQRDDEVDGIKNQLFRELLTYMMADPSTIERALELILVSRSIERIADHATNIAEDVIFVVEATDVRHHHEESRR